MEKDLRKLAAEVVGHAALEERFGQRTFLATDEVLLRKIASADPELLKVAATISPDNTLETYEALGGTYGDTT